jgi:hypothetical protein
MTEYAACSPNIMRNDDTLQESAGHARITAERRFRSIQLRRIGSPIGNGHR